MFDNPTGTLPNAAFDGTAEIFGIMPTPLNVAVKFGLLALLVTVTLPVAVPMIVGMKVILKETWLPGARLSGRVVPLVVKPVPVTATFEIEMLLVALLVTVKF